MMRDNHSQMVMPDREKETPLYDLEGRLRSLGSLPGSFVIGIFDCCRDAFDQTIFPPVESRGVGSDKTEYLVEQGQNVFLIFGCQPKKGVPAESRIVPQFFEIIEGAKDDIGSILLPDA
jgi:hypothetical protein